MKKYFTPLNIIFAVQVIVVFLTSLGFIPREAVLFLTGLMVFYMIFSPVEDALYLTVMSIPLFVALPLFENFDSMANWRILIAVLFAIFAIKNFLLVNSKKISAIAVYLKNSLRYNLFNYLVFTFILIGALSVLVADYKILTVKKLLFLINAFLLFVVVKNLANSKEAVLKIWQAAAIGGAVVIAVALIQFIAVLFVPLFDFWQFWAEKVTSVFYGQNLAHLLSYSNTWFAYYSAAPPTLRLFSVFPDSHSFAMFCILTVPIFLSLALFFKEDRRRKIFYWAMVWLALFGVVLSGSRGAWLSIAPVVFAALYFYRRKINKPLLKKGFLSFVIFALLFLFSSAYPPMLYKFQSWQIGEGATTTFSFFERAKSISNPEELSNKGRLEIWQASLKSLWRYPFFGVGLGNYVKVLNEDVSAVKKGASAHNLYLDFANESGIFGAMILILIFVTILGVAWRVFKEGKEEYFRMLGLSFFLYFLWVIVYSLFDVVLLNDKVLLLFMVELGTLCAIVNFSKKTT